MFDQILDANVNRVSEGLRVIEEYTRFVASHTEITKELSRIRKGVNHALPQTSAQLNSRSTGRDTRAKERILTRPDIKSLLVANFKRVSEGLRVLEEYTGKQIFNHFRYDVYELEKDITLRLLKKELMRGVYLISDDVDVLKQGLLWGVSVVQLRDKGASKETILNKAQRISELSDSYPTPFIVNDFLDIAQCVDADGIHTGQDDISIHHQRSILGPHKIIGRTTHSLDQGVLAQSDGADYVSVGPIWETPSKPGRPAIGFEYLKQIKDALSIPCVAIGGIDEGRIDEVMEHQPHMVGVIRAYSSIPKFQLLFN